MRHGTTAAGVSVETPAARQEEIDHLWLDALQRLSGGLAHELRNALNGVAVNLEVVRTRSAREGVPATALQSFAESAAEQVEQVIALSEALVALSRPAREPATIGRIADQVATLLRPAMAGNGGTLDLTVDGEGTTRVAAGAARLLVAAALLAAVDGVGSASGGTVALRCRVRPTSGVELVVEGPFRAPPALGTDVERMARQLGVAVRHSASSITLTFPA